MNNKLIIMLIVAILIAIIMSSCTPNDDFNTDPDYVKNILTLRVESI